MLTEAILEVLYAEWQDGGLLNSFPGGFTLGVVDPTSPRPYLCIGNVYEYPAHRTRKGRYVQCKFEIGVAHNEIERASGDLADKVVEAVEGFLTDTNTPMTIRGHKLLELRADGHMRTVETKQNFWVCYVTIEAKGSPKV